MQLQSFSYKEFDGGDQEWELRALRLFDRNLIVGRNASGKSRVLNVIYGFSQHLIGKRAPSLDGDMTAVFLNEGDTLSIRLKFSQGEVAAEEVIVNGELKLNRDSAGFGTISFEGDNRSLKFQSPPKTLATFARRDILQHPFLEPLGKWAEQVRYYPFAGELGKHHLAVFVPAGGQTPDDRDPGQTVALFRQGVKEFGSAFVDDLKRDLIELDYDVTDVALGNPVTVRIDNGMDINALQIREAGCKGIVDQFSMSTGLYRVLAVLINISIATRRGSASTILVDDIGEGLDYERSLRFIKLIRSRCIESNIQLVMTSNDKFVMNSVPLEEWTILHRRNHVVEGINHLNYPELFEDFRFTGLSNFSFFELNSARPASLEDFSATN